MSFAHPWWLPVGAVACAALLWTWRRYDVRQRVALQQFVAQKLLAELTQSISSVRVGVKRALFGVSIALLFIALAGPQAGYRWEQVKRRGNDIVFAVDTSRSMTTPDVKPNRLERAKLAIDDLVNRLNGDAVGLVAFAGTAFLQTPITLDYGAFHESLAALDTHVIPRGGTNITSAIHEALAALQRRPGSDKILILVTDGEDLEGDSLAAAKAAAQQGLKIFTVGVGTANGDLIPLPADQGGGFLKDSSGRLVKSRLDESALKALAVATGGLYAPLGADNQGLDAIYREALAPLAKHDLESRSQKVYTQRFQWPLGAAFAMLLASLMVGTRRRIAASPSSLGGNQPPARQPFSRLAASTSAALLGLCCLVGVHAARASPTSAATAYKQGNFPAAERDYAAAAAADPRQPLLQFDAGAAAYRAGEYAQAAQAFQASVNARASGKSQRLADQEDAFYNLGNTLYREGQKTEQSNPQETIQSWTKAVKTYDAALQLRADDADSRFNRDVVSRKLEALKSAQSRQNQSSQNQPQQPSQGQQSKPQQAQGQQSKDESSASNAQQAAGQGKPQPARQPQNGNGPGDGQGRQPGQPPGQPQQANAQPAQGQQNPGDTPPGKEASRGDERAQTGHSNESPTAANGSMPRPDRPQGMDGSEAGQTAQAGEDQRRPGEMSGQEARELLDSVKDEERRAPAAPVARNSANDTSPDEPTQDW
jgi:Ca-activated chloride channel family protein